jgi:hypothetical protein
VGGWQDFHPAWALQGPQRRREAGPGSVPDVNQHRGADECTNHIGTDHNGANHIGTDHNGANHDGTDHNSTDHNSTNHNRTGDNRTNDNGADHNRTDHIGSYGDGYIA